RQRGQRRRKRQAETARRVETEQSRHFLLLALGAREVLRREIGLRLVGDFDVLLGVGVGADAQLAALALARLRALDGYHAGREQIDREIARVVERREGTSAEGAARDAAPRPTHDAARPHLYRRGGRSRRRRFGARDQQQQRRENERGVDRAHGGQ